MLKPIRIIDKRNKQYFVVDDVYLNGYARYLKPIVSMVYVSLCRHSAIVSQSSYPSQKLISEEIGVGLRSVESAIATLKKWNFIEVVRDKEGRRWARNLYYLLDKKVWLKPSPAPSAVEPSPANDDIVHPHHVRIKDTHTEGYTILSNRTKKFSSLTDVTDQDLVEISEQYKIPLSMVKFSLEKLKNYCESRGRVYKNYKAALRNFVLGDVKREIERSQGDSSKRGIDARGVK